MGSQRTLRSFSSEKLLISGPGVQEMGGPASPEPLRQRKKATEGQFTAGQGKRGAGTLQGRAAGEEQGLNSSFRLGSGHLTDKHSPKEANCRNNSSVSIS